MFATGYKCYSLKGNHKICLCANDGMVCATGEK